jgi:hypothetical protein
MLVAVCGLYFVCIIVQLMLWLVSLATRPKTGSESREVARALWMDSLWSFVIASPVVSAMTGIAALLAEPGVAFRILLASAFVVSSVVMVIRGGRRYAVSWKRLVVAYILGLALHWRLVLTVPGL